MNEEIKRWTDKRKTALVLEIIQGKTSVSARSRSSACTVTASNPCSTPAA